MSDDLSGFSLMDLFRSEAEGQVATLSEGLIALEGAATTSQAIEPLMRAAHSLKGAARIVGLEPAVRIAHSLEDAFVAAQGGEFVILPPHVDVMLQAVDLLGQIAQLDENQVADWQQENEATLAAAVGQLDSIRSLAAEGAATLPVESVVLVNESATAETPVIDLVTVAAENPAGVATPAIAVRNEAIAPKVVAPIEFDLVSGPGESSIDVVAAPPMPTGDATSRVVRVSAESLSKMMALAGESLVQARQLRPFVDALMALKRQQSALSETLRTLETHRDATTDGSALGELALRARFEADRCGEATSRAW